MNISISPHFVSIIVVFGMSLLCSSILTILLTLVVSSRLWLIIGRISSNSWLIIRWIIFSKRLSIMILLSFTKTICLWNYYISANWWKNCTYFCRITYNSNLFIFNRLFIAVLINIFGGLWCTFKWTFCCCCYICESIEIIFWSLTMK